MQIRSSYSTTALLRLVMTLMGSLFFLVGCGSDDKEKKDDEKDDKPAYERVAILKHRFDQLENSLDEMERDLKLQKKRIESTRETAKAIKRSLLKGNLKGYSLDTVSTDPLVLKAIEDRKDKERKERQKEEDKEDADDRLFNSLLIILFVIFVIIIFVVALRDRNAGSSYDNAGTPYPDSEPDSSADAEGDKGPIGPGGMYEYERPNDLMPGGGDEGPSDTPPAGGTDEEPRQ